MKQNGDGVGDSLKLFFDKLFGTSDYSNKYTEKEREDNNILAFLAYVIPPLPFSIERNSKYVVFHSNQAMNNLAWFLIFMIFLKIMSYGFNGNSTVELLKKICIFVYAILCFVGVFFVMKNQAKELPIVSKVNLINIVGGLFKK